MQKKYQGLDEAIDQFDQKPLNISKTPAQEPNTNIDPKIKEQYQKFMKQMNLEGSEGEGQDDFSQFTSMMGNLLSSLNNNMGEGQQQGSENEKPPGDNQAFNIKMQQMMKGLDGGNFEQIANQLLNQFMDKDILLEPLLQTKGLYEQTFKKQDIPNEDYLRYKKQYSILIETIEILEKNPNNKEQLIKKFEQLQQHGKAPQGIHIGYQFPQNL